MQLYLEVDDFLLELSYLLVVLFELTDPVLPLLDHAIQSLFSALKKENFDVGCLKLRLHVAQAFPEVNCLLIERSLEHLSFNLL